MTDDIATFIRARLDERAATLAEIERQLSDYGEQMNGGWELHGEFGHLVNSLLNFKQMARDIDVKRRLLDRIERSETCDCDAWGHHIDAEDMIQTLGSEWSDH